MQTIKLQCIKLEDINNIENLGDFRISNNFLDITKPNP